MVTAWLELLEILLLCLAIVENELTSFSSIAVQWSRPTCAREHGCSLSLLNFVLERLVARAQSTNILTLVTLLKVPSCTTTRTRHWNSNSTGAPSDYISIRRTTSTRDPPLVLQLLLAIRSLQHHVILHCLLLLKSSIGAAVLILKHVDLGDVVLEHALLPILLKHVVVVLQFAFLAWSVHAVAMWRLYLLAVHVWQALLASIAIQDLALHVIAWEYFILFSNGCVMYLWKL